MMDRTKRSASAALTAVAGRLPLAFLFTFRLFLATVAIFSTSFRVRRVISAIA